MPAPATSPQAPAGEPAPRRDAAGAEPSTAPTGVRRHHTGHRDLDRPTAGELGGRRDRDAVRERQGLRRRLPSRQRLRTELLRAAWSAGFLVVVLAPLALAPAAGQQVRPWSGGGLLIELSMTTGLLALSLLVSAVVLPSRMRSLTRAFGIEQVLVSHRALALACTGLVGVHLLLVVADSPANLALLDPLQAPWRARAAGAATVALGLLCWLSLRRRRMGVRYEIWRMVHGLLAVVAIGGSYLHVLLLDHLVRDLAERAVLLALLVVTAAVLTNRWLLRPLRSRHAPYLVEAVRRETPTTSTLVLAPAARHRPALRHRPGQFAWIRLDSPFGPLQGHPFTIASLPGSRRLEFTIRTTGDFTSTIGALTPGRRVFVDGPYGDFTVETRPGQPLLLIAAGVGITPMMGILRAHAQRRDRRSHVLVMSGRTTQDLLFAEELERLQRQLDLTVVPVLSGDCRGWTGAVGRIDAGLLEVVLTGRPDLADAQVFVCGPSGMPQDIRTALLGLGVDGRRIHTELFELV